MPEHVVCYPNLQSRHETELSTHPTGRIKIWTIGKMGEFPWIYVPDCRIDRSWDQGKITVQILDCTFLRSGFTMIDSPFIEINSFELGSENQVGVEAVVLLYFPDIIGRERSVVIQP